MHVKESAVSKSHTQQEDKPEACLMGVRLLCCGLQSSPHSSVPRQAVQPLASHTQQTQICKEHHGLVNLKS